MGRRINNNDAFTYIELMFSLAILGIAFSILYQFLGFNLDFLDNRNSDQDAFLQARTAMYNMTTEFQKYQYLRVVDYASNPPPYNYIIEGLKNSDGTEVDKLINCSDIFDTDCRYYFSGESGEPGQLLKSGDIIAGNVKITVLPGNLLNPPESEYIRISIEAFPSAGSATSAVNLSTVIRLNHERHGLEES